MSKKGREILSKRTFAMNVRYFAVKDLVDKGFLKIMHLGTQQMLGDFFTKPLQGAKIQRLPKANFGGNWFCRYCGISRDLLGGPSVLQTVTETWGGVKCENLKL